MPGASAAWWPSPCSRPPAPTWCTSCTPTAHGTPPRCTSTTVRRPPPSSRLRPTPAPGHAVTALRWEPRGTALLSADEHGNVRLWECNPNGGEWRLAAEHSCGLGDAVVALRWIGDGALGHVHRGWLALTRSGALVLACPAPDGGLNTATARVCAPLGADAAVELGDVAFDGSGGARVASAVACRDEGSGAPALRVSAVSLLASRKTLGLWVHDAVVVPPPTQAEAGCTALAFAATGDLLVAYGTAIARHCAEAEAASWAVDACAPAAAGADVVGLSGLASGAALCLREDGTAVIAHTGEAFAMGSGFFFRLNVEPPSPAATRVDAVCASPHGLCVAACNRTGTIVVHRRRTDGTVLAAHLGAAVGSSTDWWDVLAAAQLDAGAAAPTLFAALAEAGDAVRNLSAQAAVHRTLDVAEAGDAKAAELTLLILLRLTLAQLDAVVLAGEPPSPFVHRLAQSRSTAGDVSGPSIEALEAFVADADASGPIVVSSPHVALEAAQCAVRVCRPLLALAAASHGPSIAAMRGALAASAKLRVRWLEARKTAEEQVALSETLELFAAAHARVCGGPSPQAPAAVESDPYFQLARQSVSGVLGHNRSIRFRPQLPLEFNAGTRPTFALAGAAQTQLDVVHLSAVEYRAVEFQRYRRCRSCCWVALNEAKEDEEWCPWHYACPCGGLWG